MFAHVFLYLRMYGLHFKPAQIELLHSVINFGGVNNKRKEDYKNLHIGYTFSNLVMVEMSLNNP